MTTDRTPEQIADGAARQAQQHASWAAPDRDPAPTPGWRERLATVAAAPDDWRLGDVIDALHATYFGTEFSAVDDLRAALAAPSPQEGGGGEVHRPCPFCGGETCHAGRDGDCDWPSCPQERDGEPKRSGRHCPLDGHGPWDENACPLAAAPPPAAVQVDREALNWPHRTLTEWAEGLGRRNREVAAARAILGKEEPSHQEVLATALAGVLRAIARDHDANENEFCETCSTSWPCDLTGYAFDSLAALAPLLGTPDAAS